MNIIQITLTIDNYSDRDWDNLYKCFDEKIFEELTYNNAVSFKTYGDTATREWLDAMIYEITTGASKIKSIKIESIR